MRSDGSDEQRLTTNGAYDGQPAISPDGRKIAFVSLRGGSTADRPTADSPGRIWVMNADGSGQPRQVSERSARNPAFSPDGERITFDSGASAGCFLDNQLSTGVRRQDRRKRPADADSRLHRLLRAGLQRPRQRHLLPTSKIEAILQVGCCGSGSNQVSTAWARLHSGNSSRVPSANFRLKGFSLSGDGKHAVYSSRYSEFRRWTDQRIWTGTSGCKPKCVLDDFPIAFDSEGARGDGPNYTNPSYAPRGNAVVSEKDDNDIVRSFQRNEPLTRKGRNPRPRLGPDDSLDVPRRRPAAARCSPPPAALDPVPPRRLLAGPEGGVVAAEQRLERDQRRIGGVEQRRPRRRRRRRWRRASG